MRLRHNWMPGKMYCNQWESDDQWGSSSCHEQNLRYNLINCVNEFEMTIDSASFGVCEKRLRSSSGKLQERIYRLCVTSVLKSLTKQM